MQAYDNFISQTKANLQKELEHEPGTKASVKPQIKQPKVNADSRRLLKDGQAAPKPVSGSETPGSQSEASSRSASIDETNDSVVTSFKDAGKSPGDDDVIKAPPESEITEDIRDDVTAADDVTSGRDVELKLDDDGAESDSSHSTVKSERLASDMGRPDVASEKEAASTKDALLSGVASRDDVSRDDVSRDVGSRISDVIQTDSIIDIEAHTAQDDTSVPELDLGRDLAANDLDQGHDLEDDRYDLDLGQQDTARTLGSEILDDSQRDAPLVPRLDLRPATLDKTPTGDWADFAPDGGQQAPPSEASGDQSERSVQSYSADYSDDFSSDRPATADIKRQLSLDDADDVSEHLSYQSEALSEDKPHLLSDLEIKFDLPHDGPLEKTEPKDLSQRASAELGESAQEVDKDAIASDGLDISAQKTSDIASRKPEPSKDDVPILSVESPIQRSEAKDTSEKSDFRVKHENLVIDVDKSIASETEPVSEQSDARTSEISDLSMGLLTRITIPTVRPRARRINASSSIGARSWSSSIRMGWSSFR